ncbi:VanW family protein [Petroclostridium sp. X23]|uniref:VanW family protein n=1 Tax=Petroclostridium sp. X23 TaxID=3045146 RepID=UPI0024AD2CB1|nr:VanW family protein [Petroclostridium sp. X23]WHH57236.1 VanW family protein [Petroclostridium sp. X23]
MDEHIKEKPIQQQDSRQTNSNIIKYGLIYFVVIFSITSILISIGAYNLLNYPKVYTGVHVNDIYVGGESKESAINKLTEKYQSALDEQNITISSKGKSLEIKYKDIDAEYDIEDAVLKAFNVGREGSFINKLITIVTAKKNSIIIPLEIQVDLVKLEKKIKELANETDIPVKENDISVVDDRLIIKNGMQGQMINIDEAVNQVNEAIQVNHTEVVEIDPRVVYPKQMSVEELYNKVYSKPVNADYEIKDYRIHIREHKAGISFDKEKAKEIMSSDNQQGKEYEIPLKIAQPEITKEALERLLFRDKLASYTTTFNVNQIQRSHNVILAASKINEVALGPGDIFSYNDIVGVRSEDTGFQNAKVYENGRIVDGIGGGICQISSTLYNAVLYSDLEVLDRLNHSMTVSYVPMGQDATVVYGLIDFKFKNNTAWPIKVMSTLKNGHVTFDILGTNDHPGRTIEIENQVIQTIPFTTKAIEDPNLEEGKTVIEQKGGNGYVVDTYKIVKQDGKVIKKELITRSTYRPIENIEKIGTKKAAVQLGKETEQTVQQKQEGVVVPAAEPEKEVVVPDVTVGEQESGVPVETTEPVPAAPVEQTENTPPAAI